MPGFIRVRERLHARGFEVLGIALDEADPARRFAQSIAVNYPILLGGDAGLSLAIGFGNTSGGLPYSALVDRTGRIARTMSAVMRRGAGLPGMSAVVMMMSASFACFAYISRWAFWKPSLITLA